MTYLAIKTNLFTDQNHTLESLNKGLFDVEILDLTQPEDSDEFWDSALDKIRKAGRVTSL
ncbi:MAG: hypothetical protein OQK35_03280 [Alphaproteobacteria bacterium]|nr:hypothetical protein [Rhodospirillales bacterium]MCW9045334.1 hypothetical protein [Alphaproteobacteria bacterium]